MTVPLLLRNVCFPKCSLASVSQPSCQEGGEHPAKVQKAGEPQRNPSPVSREFCVSVAPPESINTKTRQCAGSGSLKCLIQTV